MLCGDVLSNPDSPLSSSTSDDEYEELDRAPTVNMTRAPPHASKSNLLPTISRPKFNSEQSQSSNNASANDSAVTPGNRPQLRVNLASIHEHRETSVSQSNLSLHTDRRTFAAGNSAAMRQVYKTSKSLPKFHVKPEPEHVTNVPQPTVPVTAVQVSQGPTTTSPPSTAQSPRVKFTMSTPYLSSTQPLGQQNESVPVHNSGVAILTSHHSLASLAQPAVIPSPRRSAFVPARVTTPRASLTDVHSYTSPSVLVNSSTTSSINHKNTNTRENLNN